MKEEIDIETGEYIDAEVVNDNLPLDIEIKPNVNITLPIITFNYLELKEMMSTGLEEYKIEVTLENIGEAKKLATKLNKLAKTISDTRISKKKEILAPIDIFENEMKDLTDTAKSGREFITNQIKIFEDQQIAICKLKCEQYKNSMILELSVDVEFSNVDISDLFKASNVTNTLTLKKTCRETIDTRLNMQLTKQTNKKMRLMQLENQCYKADLKVMLNEADVSHFILESDLVYNEKLSEIIIREQNKQKQIELNYELEIQKNKERQLRKDAFEKEKQEVMAQSQATKEEATEEIQPAISQGLTKKVIIVATFETDVPLRITNESVLNKFEDKLKKEFPSFTGVKIDI